LQLKRTGNLIMETVGGRAVHPINVRVGGFYAAPPPSAIANLADPLRRARDAALATVEWVAGFDFPDLVGDYDSSPCEIRVAIPSNKAGRPPRTAST